MLAVPLLVHAVDAGDPEDAVPISAIHVLWWTAAHVLDDHIDSGRADYLPRVPSGEALMAAVVCGVSLPALIAVEDFPDTALPYMIREFSHAWLMSNNGQVRDLNSRPGVTTRREILATYRQKTGAAYGAVSAMAARLSTCDEVRCAQWRDFGQELGLLGQFRNDQEDLVTGRDEDLTNATATFLLHCLLENLPDSGKAHVLSLLAHARVSIDVRAEIKQMLIMPEVVAAYLRQVARLRSSALRRLDLLGADNAYGEMLRQLVEEAAVPLSPFSGPARAHA